MIVATFTSALDPESAASAASYLLSGGPAISAASLGADRTTVTLTTSEPLADGTTGILAVNVTGERSGDEDPATYSGTATFRFPDEPALHTSSLRENARKDLHVYTQPLLPAERRQRRGGDGGDLATARAGGFHRGAAARAPRLALRWRRRRDVDLRLHREPRRRADHRRLAADAADDLDRPAASGAQPRQIFELAASLTLRRTGGKVLGNLATTPGIRSASTPIAPLVNDLDPAAPTATLGLTAFARDFEAALSVPGSHLVKVAGGGRPRGASPAPAMAPPCGRYGWGWTARSSRSPMRSTTPAPPPALRSAADLERARRAARASPSTTTRPGSASAPRRRAESTSSTSTWTSGGLMLFTSVDETLTPEFTGPAQIVAARQGGGVDYLQQILDQKKLLATAASQWMIPLYAGETADPQYVRAAFYEQLLGRLANAYATRAAIQFAATVTAAIGDPFSTQPPRLFGNIVDNAAAGEERSEITLTSPKLDLATASGVPLPFLLLAAATVREDGAIVGKIDLDLTYDATHIEHQISAVPGITGYLASSWLGFIVPGDTRPLTRSLGAFPVPMVLRAFPTSPTMVAQAGDPAKPQGTQLSDLTEWTYSFVFSLPFHYPQDRVYCDVEFNIKEGDSIDAAFSDAFRSSPSSSRSIPACGGTSPASWPPSTRPPRTTRRSATRRSRWRRTSTSRSASPASSRKAGKSAHEDASRHPGWHRGGLLVPYRGGDDRARRPQGAGQEGGGAAGDDLRHAAGGDRHAGRAGRSGALPRDSRPGADPRRLPLLLPRPGGRRIPAGGRGQTIADRTVVLPGMDILQRQDAWSTIYVNAQRRADPRQADRRALRLRHPGRAVLESALPTTIDSSEVVDIAAVGSPFRVVRPLPSSWRRSSARSSSSSRGTKRGSDDPGGGDLQLPPRAVTGAGAAPALHAAAAADHRTAERRRPRRSHDPRGHDRSLERGRP